MNIHDPLIQILLFLAFFSLILFIIKKYKKMYNPSRIEGFTQNEKFIMKNNNDIFDLFYSKIYDKIHYSDKRISYEILKIIKMTQPSIEHSCFLDIGSGTGNILNLLYENGYRAYGIDQSEAMVQYSIEKYPKLEVQCLNVFEPMLYEKNTFTHILCMYFTIYSFEQKDQFFKNCFFWITPGGYLFLHLVDPLLFDTIVPAGKPKIVNSPQKYSKKRILETYVDFNNFDYHSKYIFPDNLHDSTFIETFTDKKTKNIRQNEQHLYIDTKENILKIAIQYGFILNAQINYEASIGDPYQYLIILERPAAL